MEQQSGKKLKLIGILGGIGLALSLVVLMVEVSAITHLLMRG